MSLDTTGQSAGEAAFGAATMTEAFAATAAAHPDTVAMRDRNGFELTWGEWSERATMYARALRGLGLGRGDAVAMYLNHRPETYLLDMAALLTGAAAFSIYTSCSAEQIAHQLKVAGTRVAITEAALAPTMTAALEFLDVPVRVLTLDDPAADVIVQCGPSDDGGGHGPLAPVAEDVATLIFTSGTTGLPKAAELTHANIMAALRSSHEIVPLRANCQLISYLPAAHIADWVLAYYYALVTGATITFLTSPHEFIVALPDARPNILLCVPRTWEKLGQAIRVASADRFGASFEELVAEGVTAIRSGTTPVGGRAISGKPEHQVIVDDINARFGLDHLTFAMSGSAPISPDLLEFFAAIGVLICEGYGLSETTGIVFMNRAERPRIGSIGQVAPLMEARLAEDGELLVRGPLVMRGYRGQPEDTAAAIESDGYFHTGDLASIDEDGYCWIIGRKKEIIINASGKNMSPALIERAVLSETDLCGVVVCIGDGRSYNTALIVLDPDASARFTTELAATLADPDAVFAELAQAVADAVERGNAKLSRVEQIKRHTVLPSVWAPGGDEMTPTMKVRRHVVTQKYADEIEAMYQPV